MGLRDILERIKGGEREPKRGSRAAAESPRAPGEITESWSEAKAEPAASLRASPALFDAPPPAAAVPQSDSATAAVSEGPSTGFPIPPAVPARAPEVDSAETLYHAVPAVHRVVKGVLVVVEGEPEGRAFVICDGENIVGRDAACDVVLSPEDVSRRHAKITHEDGVYWIEPLSETNRTCLNGGEEIVEPSELSDGDLLILARSALRFRTIEGP